MKFKSNHPRLALALMTSGIIAGLTMVIGSRNPALVETYYSNGIYQLIAVCLSTISAWIPFSCMQISLITFLALVTYAFWRQGVMMGLGVLGFMYAIFVGLWGLNYERPTMETRLSLHESIDDKTRDRILLDLANRTNKMRNILVEKSISLNELNSISEAQDAAIAQLEAAVLQRFGLPAITSGRVKSLYPGDILQLLHYAGLFWPWTGEHHVNNPMAPGQLAMSIAHERAHLSGFASETDANFLGIITTWNSSSPAVQYSGCLMFWRILRDSKVPLQIKVRSDMSIVDDFWEKGINKTAAVTVNRVYDSYLQTNGQAMGTRSYSYGAEVIVKYLNRFGFPSAQDAAAN